MKFAERVKIFTGANVAKLEDLYAAWYDKIAADRAMVPALKNNRLKIISRDLIIRNYKGEETFALAIFFETCLLESHEQGPDRGHHLKNGVSMVAGGKR